MGARPRQTQSPSRRSGSARPQISRDPRSSRSRSPALGPAHWAGHLPSIHYAWRLFRSCLNFSEFHFPRMEMSSPASLNFLTFLFSAFVIWPFIQRRAFLESKSSRYFSRAQRFIFTVRPLLSPRIDRVARTLFVPPSFWVPAV